MAKDPYKYFRIEARELVERLGAGVLELRREGIDAARIAELLRAAHTLKGAARIVKLGEIAVRAHALEEALLAHREGALPPDRLDDLARLVQEMEARVAALTAPAAQAEAAPAEQLESVRAHVEDLDALLRTADDVRLQIGGLLSRIAAIASTEKYRAVTELADLAGRAERDQRGLIARIEELRLVPASTIASALERATLDAAATVKKAVEVSASGGDVRVDAHVLAGVRDAMVQLVRNAVVHGLESDEERRSSGKTVPGRVEIRVERRGRRAVFACTDDGRGMDLGALRRAAVGSGRTSETDASGMSLGELVRLGGITTLPHASELAGRGVGLDVVRATMSRLRGEHTVRSAPGRGTTIELSVPTSLTSVLALVAEAGAHVVAIPLESVRHAAQVAASDLTTTSDGTRLAWERTSLPFAPCAELLGDESPPRSAWTVLVVQSGGAEIALAVDRVLGTERLVVWPLPPLTGPCPGVAGAALDAAGSPRLVLEPSELPGLIGGGAMRRVAPAREPLRILVIDDSLTTRMLEQSILESAGYRVALASSGEEGLRMAKQSTYALFLVDVEMPGMDGFTFVEQTLADADLRAVPSVLVTSRASDADKRRGAAAGARAYVVKSEFAQDRLLGIIRSLTRRPE